MNVLVICEDFRNDQFIAKPVLQALLSELRVGPITVAICQDPLLGGIDQATRWERIEEIIELYPMVHLFVLTVDRDGNKSRRAVLDRLEQRAAAKLKGKRKFIAEHAWQEIEAWALAGQDLPWSWSLVRAERDLKERYFEPFVKQLGIADGVGGGRKILGREAASKIRRVMTRCDEIRSLANRLVMSLKPRS